MSENQPVAEPAPAEPKRPPLPTVLLRPGEADRILAGHPWVYQSSVLRLTAPVPDGGLVQVKDHRQRFLGVGFYHSKSRISVRVLAAARIDVDRGFFERRIREALAVRHRHLPDASSFRVVNAESDFLSGLIVDKYEDVLVLQTSSLGMDQRKREIAAVLEAVLHPRAIIERNEIGSRRFEGLPESSGVLTGSCEPEIAVQMNGLRLFASLASGHKTGLYLDQQINYPHLAGLMRRAPGGRVLDCFSFQGAFALHLARAGAAQVLGIEQNADAVAAAVRNATANGLANVCTFETANVFDWLKSHTSATPGERLAPTFDAIVLDPPSFTRTRAAVPDALRGYKEIHLRALKLLKHNGLLATFCCSHHVDARMFMDVVLAAAFDARCRLRQIATFTQSPDHPIIPMIPETEYLKGFAFEVIRSS
jgi:23S rRNA (cytosine1962-C5)-methyltransferase